MSEETKTEKPRKAATKTKLVPAPEKPKAAPRKLVTFAQWAARRGVRLHHRRGMKAFVKTIDLPRTIAEWDEVFKAY